MSSTKPMVPLFNIPVAEYGVNLLKKYGIEDIGFTLFYLPDKIMDHFGDGSKLNVNIKYFIEESPLGTGGSVRNALEYLDDTIIVISGDALTDIDLNKAYEFHREKGSKATLILKKEPIPLEYGVVVTNNNGSIIRFLEKPSWGEVFSDTVNTGIYILEPEVFDYYQQGEKFDFSKDLFPKLLGDNIPMYGYIAKEYWTDVGDLNSYIDSHAEILKDEKKHYLLGKEESKNIWIGEGTIIEKGAKIYPPVFIGNNSLIKEGATIDAYTVIGNNTTVGEGTSIKRSIIWDNVKISKSCEIRKSVICNNAYIGQRCRIFEGVSIGSYTKVFKGTTVKPNVKIWPYKTIDENIEVKNNLIWGGGMSKKIFGQKDISGIFNEKITPEIAVGLGIAFSTVMDRKGTYLVSSDETNLSKSIKNALISGMLSTGALIVDIKNSTTAICRFGIRRFQLNGGVHIRGDGFYEDMVYMEFFDKSGANISKNISKKIEKSLSIEDFKRCMGREVQDVVSIDNFTTIYLKEGRDLLKNIDNIKNQKPKVILYSPSKNIYNLAEEYLKSLGCEVEIVKRGRRFKIEDIQRMVRENSADLGLLYSEDGEIIEITDGHSIIKEEKYYLLSLLIGIKTGRVENLVIPYHYPRVVEELVEKLVEKHKGSTIYSKTDVSYVIKSIIDEKADFQYILNFDGIWAIGVIFDYLIENKKTLSEVLKELPIYFYIKDEISCSWLDRGKVIKRLSQDEKHNIELVEGVRFIEDRGWVLVIPDEEKPILKLYIEGYSQVYAEELREEYKKKIKDIIDNSSKVL